MLSHEETLLWPHHSLGTGSFSKTTGTLELFEACGGFHMQGLG